MDEQYENYTPSLDATTETALQQDLLGIASRYGCKVSKMETIHDEFLHVQLQYPAERQPFSAPEQPDTRKSMVNAVPLADMVEGGIQDKPMPPKACATFARDFLERHEEALSGMSQRYAMTGREATVDTMNAELRRENRILSDLVKKHEETIRNLREARVENERQAAIGDDLQTMLADFPEGYTVRLWRKPDTTYVVCRIDNQNGGLFGLTPPIVQVIDVDVHEAVQAAHFQYDLLMEARDKVEH